MYVCVYMYVFMYVFIYIIFIYIYVQTVCPSRQLEPKSISFIAERIQRGARGVSDE